MFRPYRTYSVAILWNIEVRDLEPLAGVLPGVPVDGDALARSTAARLKTAEAWETLRHECIERLRGNAADADKGPARPSFSSVVEVSP